MLTQENQLAPRRRPSTRIVVAALLLASALTTPALIGCAQTSSRQSDALARLDQLTHAKTPDASSVNAPLAPGLDANRFSDIPTDDAKARGSVDEALIQVAHEPQTEPVSPSEPTSESILQYISGRSRRLAGDLQGALTELEAAAKTDPSASEPWREIGDVQRTLGDQLSAADAYRRALRLEPNDLTSLMEVAQLSLNRRDAKTAASLLARAKSNTSAGNDAGLRYVIDFNLGRSLLDLGYVSAGAELLAQGLSLPDVFDSPTAYGQQLDLLFRQRGDSWRDVGDARVRLGDNADALRAYQRASKLPSLDPAGLLPRLVYTAMKTGRPALAAQSLLQSLKAGNDLAGDRLLPLIHYIGRNSSVGPLLRQAIDQSQTKLSPEQQTRVGSLYARAAAAALPTGQSIEALRRWLVDHPADTGAVRDLFRLVDNDLSAMTRQTVQLIAQAPLNEGRYALTLAKQVGSIDPILDEIGDDQSLPAVTLRARLLQRAGRLTDAISTLEPAVAQGDPAGAATALLVSLLAQTGKTDRAEQLVDQIKKTDDPAHHLLAARSLATLNLADDALDELLPLIDAPAGETAPLTGTPNELDAVLLAANIAWSIGDADAVVRWARRGIAISPSSEAAYSRLVDVYGLTGPLASVDKLNAVVRQLRQADPSSRTLRWLRAQELIAARQYDQAERDLLNLAEEEPAQPVVDLLTSLWLRTGSATKAEGWLRSQIKTNPANQAPVLALANVLSQTDRAEQAVALLQDWLTKRPYDDVAARRLESILRDDLKRTQEADEHALARLEAKPPSFARAVELADVLIRQKETARAATELLDTVDTTRSMSAALSRQLIRAVFLIGQEAIKKDEPESESADDDLLDQALQLSQIAFDRFPQLPIELLDQHLALLAKAQAPFKPTALILDAALTRFKQRGVEFATIAVARLTVNDQAPLAVRVAEEAYPQLDSPDARFFGRWLVATWNTTDSAATIRALRATAGASQSANVLKLLPGQPADPGDRGNAQLAMISADSFAARDAPFDDVVALYKLSLQYDPNLETASNNYGYYLADLGVQLDKAEQLILHSLSIRANDPFALDSYGWVRYKEGVIADERSPSGEITREGAVSILQRASTVGINRTSPEVHNHLGDALWALGDHDRALGRWRAAQSLLEEAIASNLAQADYPELLEKIKAKLAAAAAGDEPAIAPIVGPINTTPGDPPPSDPSIPQQR